MKKNLKSISEKNESKFESGPSLNLNAILLSFYAVFIIFLFATDYFSIPLLSDDYLNVISANSSTISKKFSGEVPYYSSLHYRPIWFLSIQATYLLSNALGFPNDDFVLYRIENLLLLIFFAYIASLLLFRITGKMLPPVILSVVVLLYPNNLNNICWTIGKVDLIAGIFILASIYMASRVCTGRSAFSFVASTVFLVAGLLTKETAVVTPFVSYLLLKRYFAGNDSGLKRLIAVQAFVVMVYLFIRSMTTASGIGEVFTTYGISGISGRAVVIFQAVISLFIPYDYLSIQQRISDKDLFLIFYIAAAMILSIRIIYDLSRNRTFKPLLYASLIFFISIIPNIIAGYFRPGLIMIPFTLTAISVLSMLPNRKANFKIPDLLFAVLILCWLVISYQLIRNWVAAGAISDTAVSVLTKIPGDQMSSAIILGLPGRLAQAHMTEYATGPYNYFLQGTSPVKVAVNDAVHVSALDNASLNSELKMEKTGRNQYLVTATGATQFFQITGRRDNELITTEFKITLDSINSFGKPVRARIEDQRSGGRLMLYNRSQMTLLKD